MSIIVKICGINSAAAADAVMRAGADFGGLVFFAKSPRNISLASGAALADHMRGRLKLAALVVDADDEMLTRIAADVKPDFFQLHGKETPARAAEILARFHVPLIKVLPVADAADVARAGAYDMAEMLLFDAPPMENATRPGGQGVAFDWQILKGANLNKPWFLAGGLNPENVGRGIAASGAVMVDVSSGVESAPGVKSASLIGEFVAAARQKVAA
jgi:phosphoribosylanthranilate isomerase